MKRAQVIAVAIFAGLIAALTLFIRVPIPRTAGYLNIGDILVIFVGLAYGKGAGFLAGGLGSAAADLMGFPIFAPITLIAKGLEGFFPGLFRSRPIVGAVVGAFAMVVSYFVAEAFILKSVGLGAALTELPFNALQAAVGVLGGLGLKQIRDRWFSDEEPATK